MITQKIIDTDGNGLIINTNDNIIKLYLQLKAETKKRMLGFINKNTKTFHINRKREAHLFRKLNAYGFCYQVLADAKKFDKIRLKDETDEWVIPLSYIVNKQTPPTYLHFKGKGGFELQVFVPLENITQFKRPERF